VNPHPSIGRQIIWRLSALFVCALILSSAIFLHETWIHRVDNLDRSLPEAATRLAKSIERDSQGALQIRGSVLVALQIAEIPSLRYAVTDTATEALAKGSMPGLMAEVTKTRGGDAAGWLRLYRCERRE
jgi:hypothetical protein